jgi:hypothetical protein
MTGPADDPEWLVVSSWHPESLDEFEAPRQRQLMEGGAVYLAEGPAGPLVITSEAALIEMLGDDAADLHAMIARSFATDHDRQQYLVARGW